MSMRRAASWAQPRQVSSVPRGARTGRGPAVVMGGRLLRQVVEDRRAPRSAGPAPWIEMRRSASGRWTWWMTTPPTQRRAMDGPVVDVDLRRGRSSTPPACSHTPSSNVSRQSRNQASSTTPGAEPDDGRDGVVVVGDVRARRPRASTSPARPRSRRRCRPRSRGRRVPVGRRPRSSGRTSSSDASTATESSTGAGGGGRGRLGSLGRGTRGRRSTLAGRSAVVAPHAVASEPERRRIAATDAAPHASSRRRTGNRSSAAATDEPERDPEVGRRRARRVRPGADLRVRLDGREPAAREVVADRLDEPPGEALRRARRPSSRCR